MNFYFIMVPLRKISIKVWYSKAQILGCFDTRRSRIGRVWSRNDGYVPTHLADSYMHKREPTSRQSMTEKTLDPKLDLLPIPQNSACQV